MSRVELATYVVVSAGVALAYAVANRKALYKYLFPNTPPQPMAVEGGEWMQQWTAVLLTLKAELEERDEECCVVLVRELLWRLMGGKPHDITGKTEK